MAAGAALGTLQRWSAPGRSPGGRGRRVAPGAPASAPGGRRAATGRAPGFGPVTVWPALDPSGAGFVWATEGWITQEYGCTDFALEPWHEELGCPFHHGIDIGNLPRTPVRAARDGEVTWAGWRDDGYGYSVLLDHGGGLVTRYGHFCCPPGVVAGQRVKRGDPIGLMGSTGASSGSHLHFAVEVDGRDVDPRPLLPPEQ